MRPPAGRAPPGLRWLSPLVSTSRARARPIRGPERLRGGELHRHSVAHMHGQDADRRCRRATMDACRAARAACSTTVVEVAWTYPERHPDGDQEAPIYSPRSSCTSCTARVQARGAARASACSSADPATRRGPPRLDAGEEPPMVRARRGSSWRGEAAVLGRAERMSPTCATPASPAAASWLRSSREDAAAQLAPSRAAEPHGGPPPPPAHVRRRRWLARPAFVPGTRSPP